MLLSEKVIVKWNHKTKAFYEDKGYVFTKYGDEFSIYLSDLPESSAVKIECKCDYCGDPTEKKYNAFKKSRQDIEKDCCSKYECQQEKMKEICLLKHGLTHNCKRPDVIYKISNSQKTPYEDVVESFKKKGFTLITTENEYKNIRTNSEYLYFICNKHKEYGSQKTTLYNLSKSTNNCKCCNYETVGDVQRLPFAYIKKGFESKGYKLLEVEYKTSSTPMRYICPKHKEYEQTIAWNHLKNGEGCYYCCLESKSGENHWNWQGGITTLNNYLRSLLNGDWKLKSLSKYGYKCYITGENNRDLEIHHIYGFNLIVSDILKKLGLDVYSTITEYGDDLKIIETEFMKYSMDNLGVPLSPKMHQLFHNIYGRKNNTKEQFNEFVKIYKEGLKTG
jgi:hypothetical protein